LSMCVCVYVNIYEYKRKHLLQIVSAVYACVCSVCMYVYM